LLARAAYAVRPGGNAPRELAGPFNGFVPHRALNIDLPPKGHLGNDDVLSTEAVGVARGAARAVPPRGKEVPAVKRQTAVVKVAYVTVVVRAGDRSLCSSLPGRLSDMASRAGGYLRRM
jgi:hypothetical protein